MSAIWNIKVAIYSQWDFIWDCVSVAVRTRWPLIKVPLYCKCTTFCSDIIFNKFAGDVEIYFQQVKKKVSNETKRM